MEDLKGKVVLVTGGAQGIGAAIATHFAQLGSNVVVHFNSNSEGAQSVVDGARSLGVSAESIGADLTSTSESQRLVAEALEAFGQIDVLVNNAGSMVSRRAAFEVDDAYFDDVIDVNLRSTVSMSCTVVPTFLARSTGAIVNIGSVSGRHGGGNGAALYGAAKAAVATYTRGLARELGPQGIRVNAVSPGVVSTPFHEKFSTPESLEALRSTIPLGRLADASEIAPVVTFLASSAASYVTGQVIEVNGGVWSP